MDLIRSVGCSSLPEFSSSWVFAGGRFDWGSRMDYIKRRGTDVLFFAGFSLEDPAMRSRRASIRCLPGGLVALLLAVTGCAQEVPQKATTVDGFVPDTKPAPPINWVDATVPAGTKISMTLLTPLSAASNRPGDLFRARVTEGVKAGALLVIPEGSLVQGNVKAASATKQGAGGTAGRLALAFKVLTTSAGAGAPLSAHLSDESEGGAGGSFARLEEGSPMTIVLEEPFVIKIRQ